ncbi:hypothetical protein BJY00DRAFT_279010 [Aspergillus carlsbadensis]|nr:hypothetical protein BJY00DRAFT_279010 [Aspergillus carlsbadensis]
MTSRHLLLQRPLFGTISCITVLRQPLWQDESAQSHRRRCSKRPLLWTLPRHSLAGVAGESVHQGSLLHLPPAQVHHDASFARWESASDTFSGAEASYIVPYAATSAAAVPLLQAAAGTASDGVSRSPHSPCAYPRATNASKTMQHALYGSPA